MFHCNSVMRLCQLTCLSYAQSETDCRLHVEELQEQGSLLAPSSLMITLALDSCMMVARSLTAWQASFAGYQSNACKDATSLQLSQAQAAKTSKAYQT
eukprot:6079137-Amphidinium_carterae.1